jgi:nicotinamidase-related amidase
MIPNWGSDAIVAIRESGMIDRIQDLLAAFRAKKLPICFVSAHSTGALGTVPVFGHIYDEIRASGLEMDILHDEKVRYALDVMPELNRQPDEGLLVSWLLGAFTMSGLDIWLRLRGVNTIVFCGFAGHSVVYTSTLQASDLWYNVVIPRDATCVLVPRITLPEGWTMEEADKKVEEVAFEILAPTYSLVTTSADVVAHL